nr:MAG: replication initiator protein [Microviridae sp.]
MHEARTAKISTFITLTYNDKHLPKDGSISKIELQKFFRKLRKKLKGRRISYFACGEYGEKLSRPHYHAIIFGWEPKNKKIRKADPIFGNLYTSPELESLWTKGFSTCGAVTKESAGYVARYTCKKITGGLGEKIICQCGHKTAKEHYGKKKSEFQLQSTKPGIGKTWLIKYETDVYKQDHVIVQGKETKPPRYYDKIHNERHPVHMQMLKLKREQEQEENNKDNSLRRYEAAESIKISRLIYLKRRLENGTEGTF